MERNEVEWNEAWPGGSDSEGEQEVERTVSPRGFGWLWAKVMERSDRDWALGGNRVSSVYSPLGPKGYSHPH